ncbi:hypothetical protein DNTS_008391 [Danionella cerebrum]|uniref:Uncharacterized protein n=1 Tax=Danionella cerebrum TaxID=2873325 RepID=A0A553N0X4_9TELE|nr:hypothetical protein DNTS_008391 [Danionella translucida]
MNKYLRMKLSELVTPFGLIRPSCPEKDECAQERHAFYKISSYLCLVLPPVISGTGGLEFTRPVRLVWRRPQLALDPHTEPALCASFLGPRHSEKHWDFVPVVIQLPLSLPLMC